MEADDLLKKKASISWLTVIAGIGASPIFILKILLFFENYVYFKRK